MKSLKYVGMGGGGREEVPPEMESSREMLRFKGTITNSAWERVRGMTRQNIGPVLQAFLFSSSILHIPFSKYQDNKS